MSIHAKVVALTHPTSDSCQDGARVAEARLFADFGVFSYLHSSQRKIRSTLGIAAVFGTAIFSMEASAELQKVNDISNGMGLSFWLNFWGMMGSAVTGVLTHYLNIKSDEHALHIVASRISAAYPDGRLPGIYYDMNSHGKAELERRMNHIDGDETEAI